MLGFAMRLDWAALGGAALGCVALLGCSGTTTSGTDGGGSTAQGGGAATTGGGQGGNGGDGGDDGPCPATVPEIGTACVAPPNGGNIAHCTWGDDPRPECRTAASCNDGMWAVVTPAASCGDPPFPPTCEATPPTNGTACADANTACYYDDGARCLCSECAGGSEYPVCQPIDPPEWFCFSPPTDCPLSFPQAGSRCSDEGLSCGPDCELEIVCEGGSWLWRQGMCPMCASPATPIATPEGERPIADLRIGDLVLSMHQGELVAVPLRRASKTKVSGHQVMRLTLDNGRVLEVSPRHPTVDGRRLDDLSPGDMLDTRTAVVHTRVISYASSHTYDILPASDSGSYFAAGAQLASSLSR